MKKIGTEPTVPQQHFAAGLFARIEPRQRLPHPDVSTGAGKRQLQIVRGQSHRVNWILSRYREKLIAAGELAQARKDYDHARQTYRKLRAENFDDTK